MSAKDAKALAKYAKAKAKALAAERRVLRNDLNYVHDALARAHSEILACSVTARTTIRAFSNLQDFFKKNSSSEDAILKPLLEDVKSFLGKFNQGNFSDEFCFIWKLAEKPMSLIVLQ